MKYFLNFHPVMVVIINMKKAGSATDAVTNSASTSTKPTRPAKEKTKSSGWFGSKKKEKKCPPEVVQPASQPSSGNGGSFLEDVSLDIRWQTPSSSTALTTWHSARAFLI